MNQTFAQAVGVVAMFCGVFSFQQKSTKGMLILQTFGTLLFSLNFLLLGAYIASILNLLGCIRSLLFLKKERLHTDNNLWLAIFTVGYVGAYILTFTVFKVEPTVPNLVLQCLPVLGMFFGHLAFRCSDPAKIRRISLAASGAWLVFNVVVVAVGAIACEIFNIISIFVGMARFDRRKK
ncbi:MAG: YgjV family protein [Oscillospiraceae bacterium]|nr:YgjV family protein [Oscillospiraceae bacterium]